MSNDLPVHKLIKEFNKKNKAGIVRLALYQPSYDRQEQPNRFLVYLEPFGDPYLDPKCYGALADSSPQIMFTQAFQQDIEKIAKSLGCDVSFNNTGSVGWLSVIATYQPATNKKVTFRIKQADAPHYYIVPQTSRQRARHGGYRLSFKKSAGWKATQRKTAEELLEEIVAWYRDVKRLEPDRKMKNPEEMFVIEETSE